MVIEALSGTAPPRMMFGSQRLIPIIPEFNHFQILTSPLAISDSLSYGINPIPPITRNPSKRDPKFMIRSDMMKKTKQGQGMRYLREY